MALANGILAQGKIAKIVVDPPTTIVANRTFALEIKPPTGGVLLIERRRRPRLTR
jgi:hypothetical protein